MLGASHQGRNSMGVPSGTTLYSSSISESVTATQPIVQSDSKCAWPIHP